MFNKIKAQEVLPIVKKTMLGDGYKMVLDLEKSQGSYLYDSLHSRKMIDLFSYFATKALGHNHPRMHADEDFKKALLSAAMENPSNSDFYTTHYANFLETFSKTAMPAAFVHSFFISGGTLAVENAIKVAMDWKIKKNYKKGLTSEKGRQVIHFKEAFHGRSGYALSMTNTRPEHTDGFTKFSWPRIANPKLSFPLTAESLANTQKKEQVALEEIKAALHHHPNDICAILIEPIQSEGGDNHFRKEFFQALRAVCDEHDLLLIFDEVQNGVGLTGKFWAFEHFDVVPDMLCFGKKMQTCGVIAGKRIDEVDHNCFRVKGRINSTWGGNLADMVRATMILRIIDEENLVGNSADMGKHILMHLDKISKTYAISNVRGRGLQCAFDLPSKKERDALIETALKERVLLLGAGERSVRLRPSLTISAKVIDEAMALLATSLSILRL